MLIPLTQNACVIVDSDDYIYLSKHKWTLERTPYTAYAHRKIRRTKTIKMHRVIMNASHGVEVDHINHDGLDNRRSNLRLCSSSQNNQNQKLHRSYAGKTLSSKYKGVSWQRQIKRWMSYITNAGRRIYLGTFLQEVDAALAYDKAARQLFGEFAYLNFPSNGSQPANQG